VTGQAYNSFCPAITGNGTVIFTKNQTGAGGTGNILIKCSLIEDFNAYYQSYLSRMSELSNYSSNPTNINYYQNIVFSNIEPISNIINPIRMESLKAVDLYEDESLDMVFLDASHKYEDIKNDMIAWYPKVKKGGIFSGHDYPSWTQVVRAVEEFFPDKNFISSELCWIHRK
jgi:hypothetical protein